MTKAWAGICAFIALAFGVLKQLEPATVLSRGLVAYFTGYVSASIFMALISARSPEEPIVSSDLRGLNESASQKASDERNDPELEAEAA